jgi:CheY-like chemotaxis protein
MDTKANRKIEGTGLGLPIAKMMIEMMDGELTVESEYGKGSVFTAKIKQKYVNDGIIGPEVVENLKSFRHADQKRKKNSKLVRIKLPYAKVLIVDDTVTNLDVAKGLMKPYGMQIDTATSGQQAIDAIRDEKVRYNAIFMDHMMPRMDGVEAAERIRKIGTDYAKNIPIIALTANAIAGNERMFLSRGFQAFLTKPIDLLRLDSTIRQWVRDTKMEEEASYNAEDQSAEAPVSDEPSKILSFQIDGIDLYEGLERFGDDEESYLNILRSYAANTRSLLGSVRDVREDDLSDYAITVHGIKGSSYGICAQAVGEKAEALELASKAGDFGFVQKNNQEFIDAVEKFLTDLEDALGKIAADISRPKKDRPEKEVLEKLLEACKVYDMDTVEAAVRELEIYDYETGGELISWLWENIQQFNIDQIVEKLTERRCL